MKASDNPFPSILIDEEVDPAAPAAGHKRLFIDSADHVMKTIDSSSAVVTFGTSLADQGAFTYLDATEAAAPATPASGYARIYAKTDGRIYSKDDAGVEYGPFDAAGAGGGPLLYIDSIALHADGDEFTTDALTGWTVVNVTASEITDEDYDDTCLDLVFPAQSDRIWKAISVSDNIEISLTCYGMTNSTPSPPTATAGMIGLFFSDNAGNGTACSLYSVGVDGYLWGLTGNAYSASGNAVNAIFTNTGDYPITATDCPFQMKLKKVGNTITSSFSLNGVKWGTDTRSDSTVMTRMGIIRAYTGGGTNPTLRVGRFNVVEL